MRQDISVEEGRSLIKKSELDPSFVILDVRTEGEFNRQHLPHAINLNIHEDHFLEELRKLDRHKMYLVHCRSGGSFFGGGGCYGRMGI